MNMQSIFANTVRRVESLFPGYFPGAKHNHYADFGYPVDLTFDQLYHMYLRNGLGRAAVEKTVSKTWQDSPELWETSDPKETSLEAAIRQRFTDLRLWQRFADADRKALVGGYSGAILRIADGKRFASPVGAVTGGLNALVDIIPAWAGQLTVSAWDTNEASPNYGQPTMFSFNETQLQGQQNHTKARAFEVHPDRVIVWSQDGTVHARSFLEPGYNDLLSMEKVAGAGGEGFWKNAKSGLILEIDKDSRLRDMADAMGVEPEKVLDAMNDQVGDWQKGFDKQLLLQGMKATTPSVTLPSPEHFFNILLQGFAASVSTPLKILVGNQTGERASTEDARDWAQTNNARRVDIARPNIMEFVRRMERFRIIPEKDWTLHWGDLTQSSMDEKIDRAVKMAGINSGNALQPVFGPDEIRAVVDMVPQSETDEDFDV